MVIEQIQSKLREMGDAERARISRRFFKTGPGKYGEGDIFLGIRVPELRKLAQAHQNIGLNQAEVLLRSAAHEERLLALFILILLFTKGGEHERKSIYELYSRNTRFVNSWDLVDSSAAHIVGAFLWNRSKKPLYKLARSKSLWERRIAIVATFYFIKRDRFSEVLRISEILVADDEDLIHKAVGWMLREVGKKSLETQEAFLKKYYKTMPRTMLRYAIERFPEPRRRQYLKGTV